MVTANIEARWGPRGRKLLAKHNSLVLFSRVRGACEAGGLFLIYCLSGNSRTPSTIPYGRHLEGFAHPTAYV